MSIRPATDAGGFNNRQAKGFLVLLTVLCVPFILQYSYRFFVSDPRPSSVQVTHIQAECESSLNGYKQYPSYTPVSSDEKKYTAKKYSQTDLNTADSTALEKLPGVGWTLASRIIKYRSLLKGYVAVEQLKEVYGFSEENYDKVKGYCVVSASNVKKIPGDSLWNFPYKVYHPYITKEMKASLKIAAKNGTYSSDMLKGILAGGNKYVTEYINF